MRGHTDTTEVPQKKQILKSLYNIDNNFDFTVHAHKKVKYLRELGYQLKLTTFHKPVLL